MEDDISDDEIIFNNMTIKEVKRRIFTNNPPRQTTDCLTSEQENKDDKSIRATETCSEPEVITIDDTIDSNVSILNVNNVERTVDPDVESEDSFIRLEKLSELCVSSTENQQPQLDNTLDTINFILNNADQNKEALSNCALPHFGNPIFYTKNKEEKSNICTDIVEVCNLSKVKSKNDVIIETCFEPDLITIDDTIEEEKKKSNICTDIMEVCNLSKVKSKNDVIIETCSEPDLITIDDTIEEEKKKSNICTDIVEVCNLSKVKSKNDVIIETCSEPDLITIDDTIEEEKKKSNICTDIVEVCNLSKVNSKNDVIIETCSEPDLITIDDTIEEEKKKSNICTDIAEVCNLSKVKSKNDVNTTECNNTPIYVRNNFINTPNNKGHLHPNNTNMHENFKSPKNPASSKKLAATRKSPNKINAYQHIASPVACYIKKFPQVPLFKNVHPRKPLPGTSSTPEPINTLAKNKSTNKENIQLPFIAYKSAKKTELVSAPNQKKLPRGEWPNKLAATLGKPVVLTHEHRVVNSATKNSNKRKEDDSFDLTLQQADVSVCRAKSAFS